ncbi:TPA: YncH family protein [Escherichia coli]|nr:YncH family protein [Escherichia coli]
MHNDGRDYLNSCYVFLIYITLPFIQLVYFISSEKKLTIHIVQMFLLLSQVFYNLKMFLMMDMLGLGDAININTNKNIRQVC